MEEGRSAFNILIGKPPVTLKYTPELPNIDFRTDENGEWRRLHNEELHSQGD